MMNKSNAVILGTILSLTLLTLACGSIFSSYSTPTAAPKFWPNSTFVPPNKSIQVPLGQEVIIESYHASTEPLTAVQILVNGQPLTTEASSAAGQSNTFPNDLANVRVLTQDGEVTTSSVEPALPTYSKTVQLLWTGRVPGVYELSMVATDEANRTGNTIVQRIEVR